MQARAKLLDRLPGGKWATMSVGPAAENTVVFSSLFVDDGRAFGRGGGGAVLASKRVKALAVRGEQNVPLADAAQCKAIAANARSKVYFQLSPQDAATLGREVEPELAAHDLAHLPRYAACVRLCRTGETGPAFTLATEPLAPGEPERAEVVRADSRRRNGCERERVEALLAARQTRPWPAARS